jgi:hypothetical protein
VENINGVLDFDGADLAAEEAEEFVSFIDHEAGFEDCDPGLLAWSEAQLAHWD